MIFKQKILLLGSAIAFLALSTPANAVSDVENSIKTFCAQHNIVLTNYMDFEDDFNGKNRFISLNIEHANKEKKITESVLDQLVDMICAQNMKLKIYDEDNMALLFEELDIIDSEMWF